MLAGYNEESNMTSALEDLPVRGGEVGANAESKTKCRMEESVTCSTKMAPATILGPGDVFICKIERILALKKHTF